MITVTVAAITQLKAIQVAHPEEPIIRITMRDPGQSHSNIRITLEAAAQPDDAMQQVNGLMIALESRCVSWMDGATLDYTSTDGFRVPHNDQEPPFPLLTIPALN